MIELLRQRFVPIAAIFLLGGLAGAGLVPLIPLGNDAPEDAPTTPVTEPPTVPSVTAVVEIQDPPAQLPGIEESISTVLREGGFMMRVDRSELEDQLDPEIVRVLEASDAVITVVDSEASP